MGQRLTKAVMPLLGRVKEGADLQVVTWKDATETLRDCL